jgi:hypothetical protein
LAIFIVTLIHGAIYSDAKRVDATFTPRYSDGWEDEDAAKSTPQFIPSFTFSAFVVEAILITDAKHSSLTSFGVYGGKHSPANCPVTHALRQSGCAGNRNNSGQGRTARRHPGGV